MCYSSVRTQDGSPETEGLQQYVEGCKWGTRTAILVIRQAETFQFVDVFLAE